MPAVTLKGSEPARRAARADSAVFCDVRPLNRLRCRAFSMFAYAYRHSAKHLSAVAGAIRSCSNHCASDLRQGPCETTTRTPVLRTTCVPAAGVCEITAPVATVLLVCCVTLEIDSPT